MVPAGRRSADGGRRQKELMCSRGKEGTRIDSIEDLQEYWMSWHRKRDPIKSEQATGL